MIINNKENNKDKQHQHIPNELSVRHSPPFGGVGGGFTDRSFGGVGGGSSSTYSTLPQR